MRTVTEIYNEMLANKASTAGLNLLTSTAPTAIWRLLFFICATAIFVHEQMFEQHKSVVDNEIDQRRIGTKPWYYNQALMFQFGDDLELQNNYTFAYTIIDETKRIVARCAVVEQANKLIVKVTKTDNTPLDANEQAAFSQYINQIKMAGTNLEVYNYNPDLLQLNLDVYFNPLVLNASGQLITDTSIVPVELALQSYIENIIFGGQFNIQKSVDAVQGATGVLDVVVNSMKAKSELAATYTDIVVEYTSLAGHFAFDTLTLNYIPKNV